MAKTNVKAAAEAAAPAARNIVIPTTGRVMDYDAVPDFSVKLGLPGKWDYATKMPLDRVALANVDVTIMQTEEARAQYLAAMTAHVEDIERQLAAYEA